MAERDDDDEDGSDANDDVQVEKVAADSATGRNLIYDDWYDTIAYDTFARRPMPGCTFKSRFSARCAHEQISRRDVARCSSNSTLERATT